MNISTYVITKGLVMFATGINMNRVLNLYISYFQLLIEVVEVMLRENIYGSLNKI